MPEYIERNECRNEFYESVLCILSEDSTNDRANQIIDAFDDLPTADVQPIVHAEWIPFGRNTAHTKFYKCSNCDYEIPVYEDAKEKLYDYCPRCGAKMDGDNHAKEN